MARLVASIATLVMAMTLATVINAKAGCLYELAGVGCVRVRGQSGWIEFCPDSPDAANTNGETDNECVSIRPFGFEETTRDGRNVARVNNLRATASGGPVTGVFPQVCNETVLVCANDTDGNALNYTRIPIVADISRASTAATLRIDAYLFAEGGVLQFNGVRNNVARGSFKFDININNYNFASTGVLASFDIIVKNRGGNENQVTATNTSIDGGAIINFPQFASRTSATASWTWNDVDVTTNTRGNQVVVTFNFVGPFRDTRYDPIIGALSGSTSGAATSALAAALAFIAVLFALIL